MTTMFIIIINYYYYYIGLFVSYYKNVINYYYIIIHCLCGIVVSMYDYNPRAPGLIPGYTLEIFLEV